MTANDRFAAAHRIVLELEGGLVDDPRDPGGITKWGISLRFLRGLGLDLNRDGAVDARDIRGLKPDQSEALYRIYFWDKLRCGELPPGVDLAVFDCAVNQGPGRAARLLQKAAGARADGAIGPKTLAAVARRRPWRLLVDFMARRALHYSGLSNVAIYGRGWFRRLFTVHHHALSAAGGTKHQDI